MDRHLADAMAVEQGGELGDGPIGRGRRAALEQQQVGQNRESERGRETGSRRLIGKACEGRRNSGVCRRVEGDRARGGLARTRELNQTRRLFRRQRSGGGHEFWPVSITISVCRPEPPRGLSLIYPIYCRIHATRRRHHQEAGRLT